MAPDTSQPLLMRPLEPESLYLQLLEVEIFFFFLMLEKILTLFETPFPPVASGVNHC